MYSKRRSTRAPGSIHAPCAFQLVFTMQNAEPHEAATLPATPAASAAISRVLFIIPPLTQLKGDAPQPTAAERQRLAIRRKLEERERIEAQTGAAAHAAAHARAARPPAARQAWAVQGDPRSTRRHCRLDRRTRCRMCISSRYHLGRM